MVLHSRHDPALDRIFHALADGTRRDIVRRTLTAQPSVSELARDYAMSFAAVQKHVAVLEAAGLVHKTAVGRERLVGADPDTLARARVALTELESLWRSRLDRLDDLFTNEKE
jgi:DNA-binding transcriptional ArsR family regulator